MIIEDETLYQIKKILFPMYVNNRDVYLSLCFANLKVYVKYKSSDFPHK